MITLASKQMHRLSNHIKSSAPWLFAQEFFNKPGALGAVWPSSGRLASRMAAHVPETGQGLVIELGGGTGAVTQALLEYGITLERLLVIERSPIFVQHLRLRFPGLTIVQGDAAQLSDLIPADTKIDAIVSSLPLRSLPNDEAKAILAQWRHVLAVRGILIQFTYDLRSMHWHFMMDFVEHTSDIVWGNFPPARVAAFELRRD
ncbi:MAG: methyltransferase domain-containing protein [Glaciimonas sp.]|nr:methyltransferase domain-containing protein [Glaciimonas sp.]